MHYDFFQSQIAKLNYVFISILYTVRYHRICNKAITNAK